MSARKPLHDGEGVVAVVDEARAEGIAALDLEFMWERTYAPVACLAQVATPRGVHLIDPIEGAPLLPVAELVADPAVEVVMHAPSADLTLLGLAYGLRPARLHDVQVTAGFVGLGAGQGLATLLQRALGVRLDKGERYTDWTRRPLSAAQLEYAAGDVLHLLPLREELARRAEALGRTEWVAEEHERRYGPDARLVPDPETAWQRVKGQGRLSARDRAVLASLAAWREEEARRRDKPASWVVPDRTLVEIARRRPGDRRALESERGLPDRILASAADGLLAAVRAGAHAEPVGAPAPHPRTCSSASRCSGRSAPCWSAPGPRRSTSPRASWRPGTRSPRSWWRRSGRRGRPAARLGLAAGDRRRRAGRAGARAPRPGARRPPALPHRAAAGRRRGHR